MSNVAYLDSSAIVKLIKWEAETNTLRAELEGRELFTCSLALTEIPRAAQRIADADKSASLEDLLSKADEVLQAFNLIGLDNRLLMVAGAIESPHLGSLDAIHIAAASGLSTHGWFFTYDQRQSIAARSLKLRVQSPGLTM